MHLVLYSLVVAIWGTTWIALKWQLGSVPIALSIGYRFALAALVLLLPLLVTGADGAVAETMRARTAALPMVPEQAKRAPSVPVNSAAVRSSSATVGSSR